MIIANAVMIANKTIGIINNNCTNKIGIANDSYV